MPASSEGRNDYLRRTVGVAAWAAWVSWASDAPETAVRRRPKIRREDEDEDEKQEEKLQLAFPAEEELFRKLDRNN